MTDTKHPEALRLVEQYDYGDPVAHSNKWKAAACNELRRLHAENETLQQGYDAARLEIDHLRGVTKSKLLAQPVAWMVYLPSIDTQHLYYSQDDPGYVDDVTNHDDAEVTPLYEMAAPKAEVAPAAVAGPSETVKFVDESTADPVEKARRYLKAMGDPRMNSAYFFDDGYPRREISQGALATLAVLEQLAAAPQTDRQPAVQQWNDLIGKETHADADGLLVWRDEVDFAIPTPQADSQPTKLVEPDGRLSDELRNMIEGMSVSVDVSTGDHDAGRRYFGTVTEVMDDISDKYGVTLLVQDAEPNFALTPPTQAQAGAVPLTDEQIVGVMHSISINAAPSYHIAFARAIEAAHGLKGGQHGTE